jgi:hypothetical protein
MSASKGSFSQLHAAAQHTYRGIYQRAGTLRLGISAVLRYGRPRVLLTFRGGIGDHLLCSAVARELRRRGQPGLWLMSDHGPLFSANADVDAVVPEDSRYFSLARRLGGTIVPLAYAAYLPDEDRDCVPSGHLITSMCRAAGVTGAIALRPYLTLTDSERRQGQLAPQQIAIQSAGLSARYPIRNKEWYPDRYQAVADALRPRYTVVQLGAASDPPLEGTVDLRGKTSLRQTAAILSQSAVFVGQVGFLMHLARAVDCRSAIVYGGREHPSQSGYTCNENLFSPVPCAPCWKKNTCEFDRECMRVIGADTVVAAAEQQIARFGQPLPVDTDTIVASA